VAEIVRFEAAEGVSVLVEADEDTFGVERVSRGADGTIQATAGLERALVSARATIESALAAFGGLGFEELALEFGVKLSAEAGALIAKTAAEGHLTVTAKWGRDQAVGVSPATGPTSVR
jgi:hypothetical protein